VGKSLHPKKKPQQQQEQRKTRLEALGLSVSITLLFVCLFSAIQSSIIQFYPLLTKHTGIIESKTCFSRNY